MYYIDCFYRDLLKISYMHSKVNTIDIKNYNAYKRTCTRTYT